MTSTSSGTTTLQRDVLIVAIMASFIAFLDGSVVNVALPAIERELGGGLTVQQWVVDAYLLTLGALILLAGSLSDQFGRVRILRIGLIGFGVASLMCALAPTALVLILSRGLQGMAGAMLVPSSLALIISAFEGQAESRAIGTWTAWSGTAAIIGPLAGGLFVDTLSWRWVFGINVLPIALLMWWLPRLRELPDERRPVPIDHLGAVLAVVGLGGSVYALIEQPRLGWSSPAVWAPLAVGLAALAAFVVQERRSSHPMMPPSLFNSRNFSVGNVATLAIYGALSLGTFALTVFLQQVAGLPATVAGLVLLPVTFLMLGLSSVFGGLAGRLGPRWFMAFGPVIAGVGFLLMTSIGEEPNIWTEVMPGVIVFGVGLSITVAPLTAAVLGGVKPEHAGVGSAVNNAVARIAGLLGVAAIALISGGALDIDGTRRAMLAAAVLLFIGGVVSAIGITNAGVRSAAVD